jgi:hypothetical protein
MIPAKLLGLSQTDDSIILRAGDINWSTEALSTGSRGFEQGDALGSPDVLRSLIAMRRRGEGN